MFDPTASPSTASPYVNHSLKLDEKTHATFVRTHESSVGTSMYVEVQDERAGRASSLFRHTVRNQGREPIKLRDVVKLRTLAIHHPRLPCSSLYIYIYVRVCAHATHKEAAYVAENVQRIAYPSYFIVFTHLPFHNFS